MYTLLSYPPFVDSRGTFKKILTAEEQQPDERPFGEIYIVTGIPGVKRGGHFHPIADEWFAVVSGAVIFKLASTHDSTRCEVTLSEHSPLTLHVPAGTAHLLVFDETSGGIVLAYSNRKYEPSDTVMFNFDAI